MNELILIHQKRSICSSILLGRADSNSRRAVARAHEQIRMERGPINNYIISADLSINKVEISGILTISEPKMINTISRGHSLALRFFEAVNREVSSCNHLRTGS